MIRLAINGFGRIGRTLARVLQERPEIQLVAVNDLAETANLAHLLKYDTTHRLYGAAIRHEGEALYLGEQKVTVSHDSNPDGLKWQHLDLDIVVEATGKFRSRQAVAGHLKNAPKVILSAPPLDDTPTVVLGVNDHILQPELSVISNASCTTNSAAPLVQVIHRLCGIEHAYITTVHSYTTDQQLQDGPHKDYRRGRAAAESIVPTTTGAAKAITRIFPQLEGRIGGAGIRVPVPNGSLTDITFTVHQTNTVRGINEAFAEASRQGPLHGILGYTSDPIVSRDIIGNPYSCLFDEGLTSVLGKMVKVVGWYDNEMGYAHRLADLAQKISS